MILSAYAKAVAAFVITVLLVVVQAVTGVYDGGITGAEWLGVAAIVLGPTGLVAALKNTPFSPATKALAFQVCAVAVVLIQGALDVYNGGFTTQELLGLGVLLLSNLLVYFVPESGTPTRLVHR